MTTTSWFLHSILCFCSICCSYSQRFDTLLKGGRVMDPENNIDGLFDLGITDGRIADIQQSIDPVEAVQVVDVTGFIVTPGLVDLHAHIFWGSDDDGSGGGLSDSSRCVQPDALCLHSCVTTVVDGGGAGWKNFRQFKEQVIETSQVRVLSLINIVGGGMKGDIPEQDLKDMDPVMTALAIQNYEEIAAIKVAHYQFPSFEAVRRGVEAGELGNVSVIVDFGYVIDNNNEPQPLPLEQLLMHELRPGDAFAHMYSETRGRETVIDPATGLLRPFLFTAADRGVRFDAAHGNGNFRFSQAIPAIAQGLNPYTISSDAWTRSATGGMKDMANLMGKFMALGLTLDEVLASTTINPATVLRRPDLGSLTIGNEADIAVFNLRTGNFGFYDTVDQMINGNQKLECELTIRGGEIVWDLNGISKEPVTIKDFQKQY